MTTTNTVTQAVGILVLAREVIRTLYEAAPVVRREDLRCPDCGNTELWKELDWSFRVNNAERVEFGPLRAGEQPIPGVYVSQGDADYATLAYGCGICDQMVRFHEDMDMEWG